MRILNPAVLAVALLSTGCAVAGEAPKGKSDHPGAHDSHVTVTFSGGQRDAVRGYYAEQRGKGNCPPGLAKKGNGCQPPGQAKKRYAVGQPLPAGVVVQVVPADLLRRLGAPPPGYTYGSVDGDVLKMAVATMLVVDAIEALSN
jgi:hypothetical protein